METICSHCANRFKVPDELLGKKGRCDQCKGVFEIIKAPPRPPSKAPQILIGVAGLAIVGAGIFMLAGPNENNTVGPGHENKGTAKDQDPNKGSGQSTNNSQNSNNSINENPNKTNNSDSKGSRTKADKNNDKNNSDEAEIEDKRLKNWSLKPSPHRTDKKYLKKGMVTLIGDKKVVINGQVSVFKIPYNDFHLYLPPGTHKIGQGSNISTVTVGESYGQHYFKELERLTAKTGFIDFEAVVRQKVNELGHPKEAYLLNLIAHHYLRYKRYNAAKRTLHRALTIDPGFAPAHLNLAYTLSEMDGSDKKEKEQLKQEAEIELRLAEDFDSAGAFGLERGFAFVRRNISVPHKHKSVTLDPDKYRFKIASDDPVVEACFLFARLAKTPLDAVSAHNNAGLRLLNLKNYDDAYGVFIGALRRLSKQRPTVRGRLIATTIYSNLARLYDDADWAEAMEIPFISKVFPQGP
jgi:tetratricopeptide (TPR) repeat protein